MLTKSAHRKISDTHTGTLNIASRHSTRSYGTSYILKWNYGDDGSALGETICSSVRSDKFLPISYAYQVSGSELSGVDSCGQATIND
nr:hypothetical protein CFP56_65910 [Quercus suber]